MNAAQFQRQLPNVTQWIGDTIAVHKHLRRAVASFGFRRLQDFYSPEILSRANVIVVDRVPKPPLTAMGLNGLADFENFEADGITYGDTYFLQKDRANDEVLHFHELVHVVQWHLLGIERFIIAYAMGLRDGYESNPFEVMAYEFQARFSSEGPPFNVEAVTRSRVEGIVRDGADLAICGQNRPIIDPV